MLNSRFKSPYSFNMSLNFDVSTMLHVIMLILRNSNAAMLDFMVPSPSPSIDDPRQRPVPSGANMATSSDGTDIAAARGR